MTKILTAKDLSVFNAIEVSNTDNQEVIAKQLSYVPKVEEVFKDAKHGDYWFLNSRCQWNHIDHSGVKVRTNLLGNSWQEIVEERGPVTYVGNRLEVRHQIARTVH